MTVTTEEAEELAKGAFILMDDPPDPDDEIMLGSDFLVDLATTIRFLAAERDAASLSYLKVHFEFHKMQRRIARQRRALAKLYQRRHHRNALVRHLIDSLATARRDAIELIERGRQDGMDQAGERKP